MYVKRSIQPALARRTFSLTSLYTLIVVVAVADVDDVHSCQHSCQHYQHYHHSIIAPGHPNLAGFYGKHGYVEGERKARTEWFDVSPEYREGLYFVQMVKML